MRYLLIVCLVVVLLVTPAFAAAADDSVEVLTPDVYVTVESEDLPVTVIDVNEDTSIRSQLTSALIEIFGEYTPRTQTVTTYLPDGSSVESVEIVPGLAGLDWIWISAVVLFGLFLFCLMRLLGGAVK